jgi:hypothetical protein
VGDDEFVEATQERGKASPTRERRHSLKRIINT